MDHIRAVRFDGEPVNQKCVQRLMQKMGLRALIRAKKRSRDVPRVSDSHVPNVVQRDFCASAPNQKWATDVTEFNVDGNKLYLSACMDQVRRRTDRALGPRLALQDAALPSNACEPWRQAKHES